MFHRSKKVRQVWNDIWRWVNYDRISFFEWTLPLRMYIKIVLISVLHLKGTESFFDEINTPVWYLIYLLGSVLWRFYLLSVVSWQSLVKLTNHSTFQWNVYRVFVFKPSRHFKWTSGSKFQPLDVCLPDNAEEVGQLLHIIFSLHPFSLPQYRKLSASINVSQTLFHNA